MICCRQFSIVVDLTHRAELYQDAGNGVFECDLWAVSWSFAVSAGAMPLLTYYMTNCHVPSSHELVAGEEGIWSDLELEEALVTETNRVRAEHGLSVLLRDAVIQGDS